MAAIRTAFKLLDEQLHKARPTKNVATTYRYRGEPGDERVFKNPKVVKAQAEFDKLSKAHAKAGAKLNRVANAVADKVNKGVEAEHAKKLKAWEQLQDEVEHLKITLSLGGDASEQVLALLKKLKAL